MVASQQQRHMQRCLAEAARPWLLEASDASVACNPWWQPASTCLLEKLREALRQSLDTAVSRSLVAQISVCLQAGYTLRSQLPRVDRTLQRQWLGQRLVWMHAAQLTDRAAWVSWVSSRIGRDGRECAQWPMWLSAQVRDLLRAQSHKSNAAPRYLYIPGTTLSPLAWPLVRQARLATLRVDLPPRRESPEEWLCRVIRTCSLAVITEGSHAHRLSVSLSPSLSSACAAMEAQPLQDRVAVCWADRVFALSLRDGGTTDRLLRARLHDIRFPPASVSVAIGDHRDQLSWLSRGAVGRHLLTGQVDVSELNYDATHVGWSRGLLPRQSTAVPNRFAAVCGQADNNHSLVQLSWSLHRWSGRDYLVHCVRGDQGRSDSSPATERVIDAWLAGQPPSSTAWETLLRIIDSGRLRGNSHLNRTGQATVSLSAVPLEQLLSRRRFQSHLGRWDWEPYGVAIRRDAIEALNGRPVIYGNSSEYEQLSFEERPYFQPMRWQSEQEWRVVGDIRLHDLPIASVRLFVHTRTEADQLARHSPWPVAWCVTGS